jgi:hypothetical protein
MITGTFLGGTIAISQNGVCTMGASVSLQDDQLGQVGQRSIPVDDPAVIAQVQQFVAQMMPMLSAQAGFTITLPEASE